MATIDATINVTLDIDDDTWYEAVEAHDGDEYEAMKEVVESLEFESGRTEWGEWWATFADPGGWIDFPAEDNRPLGGEKP